MSHEHGTHERTSPAAWWITAALAVTVYVVGAAGFWRYHQEHPEEFSASDTFYSPFQLFAIEPPHLDKDTNGAIEAARWGALALDMFAVFVICRRMFAQEIARARLRRTRNHFVVLARPHDARVIAGVIRRRHPNAIVAILDGAHGAGRLIEKIARNTFVVPGDARSAAATVQLHQAAEVIVSGPDDGDNLAAATEVAAIANRHRTMGDPLVCHVQIQSIGVRETLRRAITTAGARAEARAFDHFERAVTRLFTRDLPLDGNGIAPADPTTVHVVIIGHGDWALAAAGAAVRLGHFANRRPLRLTVITDDETGWSKRLNARFDAIGELTQYEVRASGPQTKDGADWLRAAAHAEHTRLYVVIAPMNDADAVEIESAVRDAVRGTGAGVAVRLQHGALSRLLAEGGSAAGVDVVPFGWLDDRVWTALLEDDEREFMARLVQDRFEKLAQAHGRSEATDGAVAPWRRVRLGDYKESNRQQVDHLWLKLRAVGCEAAEASDSRPASVWSAAEIDVMSEMEHSRWVAERRLNGWRLAPEKNDTERLSPHLVPWADLDEPTKNYDRDAVKNIPELLRATGARKICRR